MATLSDLRSELRTMLRDSGPTPIWTDDELTLAINQAIVAHTTEVPFAAVHEYATAKDVNEFDLPDDFVDAAYVRGYFASAGRFQFITELDEDDWMSYWQDEDEPIGFRIHFPSEGKLYLPRAPLSEPITLYYGARRSELSNPNDTLDLGTRAWSEEAVCVYAAYRALEYASTARAQLEQWEIKIDQKVDNPLEQEARRWLMEYRRLVDLHVQAGAYGFS